MSEIDPSFFGGGTERRVLPESQFIGTFSRQIIRVRAILPKHQQLQRTVAKVPDGALPGAGHFGRRRCCADRLNPPGFSGHSIREASFPLMTRNGPHRQQPFRIVGTGSRNHVLRDHYDPLVVRGKNVPEDLAATLSPTDSVPLGGRSW
jgi:hypothetical protein